MDPFLAWLESTALSQWVVGSPSLWAFPGILALHAIGMAFAVGVSVAWNLRVLGVARRVPLPEMQRFLPVFWFGFWLNAASGVLLLVGYPTKALTNPVFYLKLLLIAVGVVLLWRLSRRVNSSPGLEAVPSRSMKRSAIASVVCWAGAITAGRLLAYTYSRLTAAG